MTQTPDHLLAKPPGVWHCLWPGGEDAECLLFGALSSSLVGIMSGRHRALRRCVAPVVSRRRLGQLALPRAFQPTDQRSFVAGMS